MAFNKGYELKKFEAHWEKLRIEYAAAGMAEDAIQKMYDYDRQQFNSERTRIERTQEFTAPAYESTEEEASPLMLRYQEAITTTDTYHETKRSFAWIGEIEDENPRFYSESEEPPMTENKNRVCCLYRVSTDKQVDFNSNHEADLPMQRKACHKFAEAKGWVIVHEEQEEGVSGHKVRAEARDKLQIIKEYARKGKFDILLVFMFDRIGRIADETPFVVEWFVRNGIRVWSTQEGEQRFDNHTDKLLNYIRFWQADGESEKTSVRTRTSLRQLVEEGHFKGCLLYTSPSPRDCS